LEDFVFYATLLAVFSALEIPLAPIGIVLARLVPKKVGHRTLAALLVAVIRALFFSPTLLRYHGFALVPTLIAPYWWIRFPEGFGVELLSPFMLIFLGSFGMSLYRGREKGEGGS
jgi:hypothetical protein